jgi:carbamoyltransferase
MKRRGATGRRFVMEQAYFGPSYRDEEIGEVLRTSNLSFAKPESIAGAAADLLAQEKVIGWFQGRMEFGPRALGARSILASPRGAGTQERLNWIKDREDFRPLAPVVIEEEAADWFRVDGSPSPFMLFVHEVLPGKARLIPAVCHVDNTARIQTVRREQNPAYYDTLRAFQARTGIPVLVNTSFNTRTRPIVCSPRDALECFFTSPLDALVLGGYLLVKQPGRGAPEGHAD